jgi:hypothetical protein
VGSRPPEAAFDAAAKALMSAALAEDQRRPLADILGPFAKALPKPELDALVSAFTRGAFSATPDLEARVSLLLRESADARAQLIQWLESSPPATDSNDVRRMQIEHALWTLQADLGGMKQLPAREYVERILSILRKHAAAPAARRIFENITGAPMP